MGHDRGGKKDDGMDGRGPMKDPWHLLPFGPVADVVKVLAHGAQKYAPEGWRKVENPRARYFSAAMRHLLAWWGGERVDPESGLPHLAHAACCIFFLAEADREALGG